MTTNNAAADAIATSLEADLIHCDKSPIHLFSSIQSHGALLAFTFPDQRIQVISQNTDAFLGRPQSEVLGSKLEHVFDKEFIKDLVKTVAAFPWKTKGFHMESKAVIDDQSFDAFVFHSDGLFVIELERDPSESEAGDFEITEEKVLQNFSMESKEHSEIAPLGKIVCKAIREITGLDRVMLYRFVAPTFYGEVLAEDRVTSAHTYLGHRFPATD
ncbi:MAG: hypothetical protein V4692_00080, partial [Bdellovibrionota bacterium]